MAKILVVDDEPAIVTFVTKILEARNHEVVSASDGEAGLEAARREMPDVMVLDINLPKLDGLKVCRTLKSEEATKHIGIVMITAAYTTVEDANAGEDCGADEYVVKPFLREVLLHNVERLIPDPAAE
jgi:DNA-binding response OmpR family regulator|tara:strand:- start:122 stop:502 length:381 start_codon:yes stop_codon:yes gene_type:complete